MKTKKEIRIEFYGKDDARAYDNDELYIMQAYADQFKPPRISREEARYEASKLIAHFLAFPVEKPLEIVDKIIDLLNPKPTNQEEQP